MDANRFQIEVDGRRSLDVWVSGPEEGTPLVFHHGTPASGVPFSAFGEEAARRGIRSITYSRPGYGGSTRAPGRSVADCAADTAAILDHLGAGRALTLGWSGGGPHTLAVAGLLPERVIACASIAGAGPYGMPDLDFLEGMGKENIEEFGAAIEGPEALTDVLERDAPELARAGPDELADALGDLIPEVDRASLTGTFAAFLADAVHEGLRSGIGGWFDDDLAFVRPWGFDLSEIRVPVFVWQGAQDRMVPFAHGQWLADHVPGSTARLLQDEGHLSMAVGRFGEILDDLLESI